MKSLVRKFVEENSLGNEQTQYLLEKFERICTRSDQELLTKDCSQIKESIDKKREFLDKMKNRINFQDYLSEMDESYHTEMSDNNEKLLNSSLQLNFQLPDGLSDNLENGDQTNMKIDYKGRNFEGESCVNFFKEKQANHQFISEERSTPTKLIKTNGYNHDDDSEEQELTQKKISEKLIKFRNSLINNFHKLKCKNESNMFKQKRRQADILKKQESLEQIHEPNLIKNFIKELKQQEKTGLIESLAIISIDQIFIDGANHEALFDKNFHIDDFDENDSGNINKKKENLEQSLEIKIAELKKQMNGILSKGKRLCDFINGNVNEEIDRLRNLIDTNGQEFSECEKIGNAEEKTTNFYNGKRSGYNSNQRVIEVLDDRANIKNGLVKIWEDNEFPVCNDLSELKSKFDRFEKAKELYHKISQYKKIMAKSEKCYDIIDENETPTTKNLEDYYEEYDPEYSVVSDKTLKVESFDELNSIIVGLKRAEVYQKKVERGIELYNQLGLDQEQEDN